MKRRVNIGVALLHKPKVLYLDEPTVGIDPQSRRSILDGILALRDQGMTVLYTTHYMAEAQELSDRIGIIDHGKMIALGTHAELVKIVGEEARVDVTVDQRARGHGRALGGAARREQGLRRGGPRRAARRGRQRGAAAPLRGGGRGRLAHHVGERRASRTSSSSSCTSPAAPCANEDRRSQAVGRSASRSMTKVWAIAWKDLRSTMRNVPALAMMLLAPLALAGLLGFAFGGGDSFEIAATKVALASDDVRPAAASRRGGAAARRRHASSASSRARA